jgi:hypothetical protein
VPRCAGADDLQASSLVVTDCAVKVWKAEWIDAECDHWSGICIPIPERITSAIFDTEPDLVSPDCQDSIGNHYDTYFPSAARSAVSALSGGEDIPNGDEVCHLICEQGCGSQWTDPTRYFLAAEVRGRKRQGERREAEERARAVELPSTRMHAVCMSVT